MYPIKEATSCCGHSNTFPKIEAALALALAVTAAALIALGHLQFEELILPGYYVAGAAGVMAIIALLGFSFTGCMTWASTDSLSGYKGAPAKDPNGFENTVIRPHDNGFGGVILPYGHVQLNSADMQNLELRSGDSVLFGQKVYKALTSDNVPEHSIGISEEDCMELQATGIPSDGILKKFNGQPTIAQILSLELSTFLGPTSFFETKCALYYDSVTLKQELKQKLQGQIFTQKQFVYTKVGEENIELTLRVLAKPGYHLVNDQTTVWLLDENHPEFVTISFQETTPLGEATLSFVLKGARHRDGDQYYPEKSLPKSLLNYDQVLPNLTAKMRDAKSKVKGLPKTIGCIPLDAFWKVGETVTFCNADIMYVYALDKIETDGKSYRYAVTGSNLNPKEIKFLNK